MPPQDLPPGLYDHPLSAAIHQALASTPDSLHQLQPLDPAEAPQRLARYLRQLSETALASLPEAQRQQQQLALVNQIVALLQQQAPNAISTGDQLHPSARLLQELRATPLMPNEAPLDRPLIPLADGTLLINAPSEPSIGLALQAECPIGRSNRSALRLHQMERPAPVARVTGGAPRSRPPPARAHHRLHGRH